MSKIKIAIQGELGAYSHIAVEKLYKDAEIKTCATFEDTFKQAYNDPNCKIVIPIENSLAGRVADIHYLLPKYKLLYPFVPSEPPKEASQFAKSGPVLF